MPVREEKPVVAVIGGGFSGAAFAFHLLKRHGDAARVVIFEPRETLGAGLAYSAKDPAHRVNVPAGRMSIDPDDPESFLRFTMAHPAAQADPHLLGADGQPYPARSLFGTYARTVLEPFLASGAIEHRRAKVREIARLDDGWLVEDGFGPALRADIVVLAATHPAPDLPRPLKALGDDPRLITDVTREGALDGIGTDERVLIVGNGLTAADVIASLRSRGHRGKLTAISRRGLRSRGHPAVAQDPFGDFASTPSRRASHLLHRIRRSLREAAEQGIGWHAVLDAVRQQGFAIWQALPLPERRRIVRFARPFWDAHRFRIAPQVEKALDDAIADNVLSIRAAALRNVVPSKEGFTVTLTQKGSGVSELIVDRIVVTTGPAHGRVLQSQPFLETLAADGVLTLCGTGLGIACDLTARAIDAKGEIVPSFFIAGPLARGTFGELMGLPQVTEHAVLVADQVGAVLAKQSGESLAGSLNFYKNYR
ncbi:FAD/NAD(P)-binding protein [Rhizobium paknamense]|uniref:NAD(P)/FAD-binding protein YdhS n=1 Tax=Rhizobium paknamense TaxID=1206817 RepID=A0ABU0IER6_9HYPH|nr:FAD/NAD(P)-binding protein [Rhizobium paknamense]MDQ0455736.1 putative NAD(P)/FAD-binding protein YdhS [Rhizobium paknamense]